MMALNLTKADNDGNRSRKIYVNLKYLGMISLKAAQVPEHMPVVTIARSEYTMCTRFPH